MVDMNGIRIENSIPHGKEEDVIEDWVVDAFPHRVEIFPYLSIEIKDQLDRKR